MSGFDELAALFDGQIAAGLHDGAQIAVRHRGKEVFARSGGSADRTRRRPVDADTPFMIYSATKPFTATCVHKLADEGRIALDAPAATYWPEFAARGKDRITVAHLLLHQAGIPGRLSLPGVLPWVLPRGGARRAAAMVPEHEPGAACVYHAVTAGFVLGEIIRRVSGKSAAAYLTDNFLRPLGMRNSYAGLPFREYGRASRIRSLDPEQANAALVFSNPLYRSLFVPAASLNATARDVALFYQMLLDGGELGGTRYLSRAAVERATAARYDGPDGDSDRRVRWAMGFVLGGYSPWADEDLRQMGRGASERCFGHSGQGGCAIGWADPESDLAFAFVCNGFLEFKAGYRRFQELADAARAAAG